MRFNLLLLVVFFSLFSLAFAQLDKPADSGFGQENGGGFGTTSTGGGSLGAEVGRGIGSSIAQQSGLEGILAEVMELLQVVLRIVMFAILAFVVIFLIWLVILLIVLANIMKRDDLTGGEKAAWVAIVFFFGFLPLSPIGMLLYALSGGGKKPVQADSKPQSPSKK